MSTYETQPAHGSTRLPGDPDAPPDALADDLPVTPWTQTQATDEFQALRRSLRRFAFPATVAFLAWYLLYVIMSGYARGFMDTRIAGHVNVAYVFGLLQFVSTFGLAYLYSRYADRKLDPTADAIRARLEDGAHR